MWVDFPVRIIPDVFGVRKIFDISLHVVHGGTCNSIWWPLS
jgi:hypothetical protein